MSNVFDFWMRLYGWRPVTSYDAAGRPHVAYVPPWGTPEMIAAATAPRLGATFPRLSATAAPVGAIGPGAS